MKNDSANSTASVLQTAPTRQKTRNTSVSIKDVARKAKVAPSTVSAALSGNGPISNSLRDKVTKIAAEMNYRPRMAAQLLRANNTGYIGLLFAGDNSRHTDDAGNATFDYAGWYTTHFLSACQAEGLRSQIEFVMEDDQPNTGISQLVHGGMLDGVIVVGMNNPDCRLAQQLREQNNIPWITFDEPSEHCVLSAADMGIEQAVQHLAALGHRKIAMTHGPLNCEIHNEVKQGFGRALNRFGIECRESWSAQFANATGENKTKQLQWITQLLNGKDRPTAIICGGSATAGMVLHLATEMDISIPRDLSVIAVGYSQLASVLHPRPVMIEADFAAMMRLALDNLRARIADRPVNEPVQRVMPHLTNGDTVALAPTA